MKQYMESPCNPQEKDSLLVLGWGQKDLEKMTSWYRINFPFTQPQLHPGREGRMF